MAFRLSSIKIDSKAIAEGRWMPLGEDYGDIEVHVCGLGDAYYDAQARLQKIAAKNNGKDNPDDLSNSVKRAINIKCLIDHVVLGIRNAENDDGSPTTTQQFQDMLMNADYAPLVVATYRAAIAVGSNRKVDLDEMLGNSKPASTTTSEEGQAPTTSSAD